MGAPNEESRMAGAATVEKALDVLFHLHEAGRALGLSEIGRNLSLPKSSCHRLLASLVERDVVERDAAGRYQPGLALLSLGLAAQGREPLVRAARPILEEESSVLGETVFLVGMRRGRLRVLDKSEGSGFLRAAPEVGDVVPSDVTAAGKLYADARRGEGPGLRQAVNRDAWIEGLSVLAVPIHHDQIGEDGLAGVLALGAASARFDALGEERVASRLLAAAERVRARLGLGRRVAGEGRGDGPPGGEDAPNHTARQGEASR